MRERPIGPTHFAGRGGLPRSSCQLQQIMIIEVEEFTQRIIGTKLGIPSRAQLQYDRIGGRYVHVLSYICRLRTETRVSNQILHLDRPISLGFSSKASSEES